MKEGDKRKFNGGHKTAGRKPKAVELKVLQKLHPMAKIAFAALEKGVKAGDFNFIKLYLSYYIGLPKQQVDITSKGERINAIFNNDLLENVLPIESSEENSEIKETD